MSRRLGWLMVAAAMAVVFLGHPWPAVAGLVLAVAAALILDREVLVASFTFGVVLTILFSSAAAGAVVVWSADWMSGLEVAAAMLLRLMVLVVAAALLARNVDAEALLRVGERLGLERLGLTLGLALNVLPQLVEATRQVAVAWRVRRRSKAAPSPSPLQLVEVLLAHVARIADEAAAAAALRGHSALLQRPVVTAAATPVVVATGRPGAGKTTVVQRVVQQLEERGQRAVGIVQPGTMVDGHKTGFVVRDLVSGDESELARLVSRDDGEHGTRFRFHPAGFALAAAALGRADRGDVLVVDELGPLELRGQGHMPAVMRALRVAGLAAVVIVVRVQLVPALLAALRVDDAVVVDVTASDGGARLLNALEQRGVVQRTSP
jgi:nucleoside-triphosphatase THEP1